MTPNGFNTIGIGVVVVFWAGGDKEPRQPWAGEGWAASESIRSRRERLPVDECGHRNGVRPAHCAASDMDAEAWWEEVGIRDGQADGGQS